jgi:glycosyltransferase involved in cell wall biosynthesis
LLGRRDQPTDALEDYCRCLGRALAAKGYALDLARMPWPEKGWLPALNWLSQESKNWKASWVLVQYTALSWSKRGFPLALLVVLGLLRSRGSRIAVIFHDPNPYHGTRSIDKIRRSCQSFIMRWSYRLSDKVILPIPIEHVSWLPANSSKASFIPVGANIPAVVQQNRSAGCRSASKTITVFGVTGGGNVGNEVSDIAFAVKSAAKSFPEIRLLTLGRGSAESEPRFRKELEGSAIEYSALGVLPAHEVTRILSNSDVSLFVRGTLSTQKGSSIASIACAVPLVAYVGQKLAVPFLEAGVVPVPLGDCEQLAVATVKVLTDRGLWSDLHQRNQRSYEKYFAWDVIADRLVTLLGNV